MPRALCRHSLARWSRIQRHLLDPTKCVRARSKACGDKPGGRPAGAGPDNWRLQEGCGWPHQWHTCSPRLLSQSKESKAFLNMYFAGADGPTTVMDQRNRRKVGLPTEGAQAEPGAAIQSSSHPVIQPAIQELSNPTIQQPV